MPGIPSELVAVKGVCKPISGIDAGSSSPGYDLRVCSLIRREASSGQMLSEQAA
jgi:hypothetical protein